MLEAIILGIIQGLIEFIPISSSAHLRLAGEVFPNAIDPGAMFTAITQIGTELAVLIYFRKDIVRITTSWFASLTDKSARNQDSRMGWLIIVGSIPIVGDIALFIWLVVDAISQGIRVATPPAVAAAGVTTTALSTANNLKNLSLIHI